jgi:biopolymer transport protein ExbB/TolQ
MPKCGTHVFDIFTIMIIFVMLLIMFILIGLSHVMKFTTTWLRHMVDFKSMFDHLTKCNRHIKKVQKFHLKNNCRLSACINEDVFIIIIKNII